MGGIQPDRYGGRTIERIAVVISGPPGAGKTTLAAELAEALDVPCASFGDVVRAVARQRGAGQRTADLEEVGRTLIAQGWVQFCSMLLEPIPNDADVFLVEGVRHAEAVQTLRQMTGRDPVWIFVDADQPTLAQRLARRDQTTERDQDTDMERAAAELMHLADLVIVSPWQFETVITDVHRLLDSRMVEGQ